MQTAAAAIEPVDHSGYLFSTVCYKLADVKKRSVIFFLPWPQTNSIALWGKKAELPHRWSRWMKLSWGKSCRFISWSHDREKKNPTGKCKENDKTRGVKKSVEKNLCSSRWWQKMMRSDFQTPSFHAFFHTFHKLLSLGNISILSSYWFGKKNTD